MSDETLPAARAANEIDVIAVSGPSEFERARLSLERPVTVGRSTDCDLVLPEGSVSREHAQFIIDNGKVQVKDLESRAGTAVNMMFLEKGDSLELNDRDLVTIGPWKILVRIGDGDSDRELADQETSIAPDDETLGAEPVMAPPKDATPADKPDPKSSESDSATKKESTPRGDSAYTTRASIFLRLQADGSLDRELGWQEFTEKYARVIAGFARNAGLRAQDADDVLQDVLLGFFRVSDQFDYDPERGRFRGYLKRVTLNAIRARHRRKRPSTFIKDDYDPPAELPDVDAAWDRQWTEQLLQRAMTEARGGVEERTWKAFELYGVRGVPVEQVATELDMTPAAIRHAKMRLVKQVREIVDRLRAEEG